MSDPGTVAELEFSLMTSPELAAEPWAYWDVLRAEHDAFLTTTDVAAPTWTFTRFDAIYEGLRDYELFSSAMVDVGTPVGAHRWIPEELDPPEHTKYRQILTRSFAPAAIEAWEPRIREHCSDLIDAFADTGHVEVDSQFSRKYPTIIFMEMMGLPTDRADELLGWVHDMMHTSSADDPDGAIRGGAVLAVAGFLDEEFKARRTEPRDDLMTELVQGDIDGRPLTDAELSEYGFLLYMAGLDTVANVIGAILKYLAEHDDQRQFLREDEARIPGAVEEFVRYFALVNTGRLVTRDAEFHGCPMEKGDRALFSTTAANRDARAIPDADKVILDRQPNRHIGFGAGPHRCLGSNLARLELVVALEEWHRRVPDYHVVNPERIRTKGGGVVGMQYLELAW